MSDVATADPTTTAPTVKDPTPLIRVEGVSKQFRADHGARVHAVVEASLDIHAGETVAVVGESGCGKSTLANLIIRLHEADTGRVLLKGTDITHLGPRAMREHRQTMQIIFQDPFASLDPRVRVGRSVAEPLQVNGFCKGAEAEERVGHLFELVGLQRIMMKNYPHQFSGGQRQRVCIARALTLNPELVIADEAVSALDVSVQAQVMNLMLELQQELGLSYLFISHDLAVVERIAHRVAVMYLGQIVELGSREQIFRDPRHSYTKRLLNAVPIADPRQRTERALLTGEIPSPVWPTGQGPEVITHTEVEPGHLVADE
ncbi:MAG: ATP-binding cassette domain-containing protein [Acidimicrobiales bacterium]|jgi:ABC-type glutathione transport system ATPase component|nr:ATP-binding cassette domain-containing protein [Acidimicrobiales bacterium]|tara:strand:+ start:584 stop:1534 length:951 start_codon:yes stop_codon:yes gene_type:complete